MILSRNLSGVPSSKPSAKNLAKLSRDEASAEYKASLPPPVVNTQTVLTDALPERNAQMDEISRYFSAKRSLDEAHRAVIRASQNAKMDTLVAKAQAQALTTYSPASSAVQEAFYLAQTDPSYFERSAPSIELMKALASLYVEKGLQVPKQLQMYAPRPKLSLQDEADVIERFKDAIGELETQANETSTVPDFEAIVRETAKLIAELENTGFAYNPKEKTDLLAVANRVLDTAEKSVAAAAQADKERDTNKQYAKQVADRIAAGGLKPAREARLVQKVQEAEKKADEAKQRANIASPLKGLAEELGAVKPAVLRPLKPEAVEDNSMVPTAIQLAASLAQSGVGIRPGPAAALAAAAPQRTVLSAGVGPNARFQRASESAKLADLKAAILGVPTPELASPANEQELKNKRQVVGNVPEYSGRGTRAMKSGYAQTDEELRARFRQEREVDRPARKAIEAGLAASAARARAAAAGPAFSPVSSVGGGGADDEAALRAAMGL